MTTIKEHKKIIKELFEDINEKTRAGLLVERQKIIGFAASEASTNLFALFLHKKNLISPGFNVNHRFFGSAKQANQYFSFDFPRKKQLLSLLVRQENLRDHLCYGKEKEAQIVRRAIKNLFKITSIIEEEIGEGYAKG